MHVSVLRRLENSYSVEWNVPLEHKNGNEHTTAGRKTWFLMYVTIIHERSQVHDNFSHLKQTSSIYQHSNCTEWLKYQVVSTSKISLALTLY